MVIEGCITDWRLGTSGVPQGSLLSPQLFDINITDLDENMVGMIDNFTNDTKIDCIVDDAKSYLRMQQDLGQMGNSLSLSPCIFAYIYIRTWCTRVNTSCTGHCCTMEYCQWSYAQFWLPGYRKGRERIQKRYRREEKRREEVACWGGSIKKRDESRINKLVRKASSVVGTELESMTSVAESRALSRLRSIMENHEHPLHSTIQGQRSSFSRRLLSLQCSTDRLNRSLIHNAIRLYNSNIRGGFSLE